MNEKSEPVSQSDSALSRLKRFRTRAGSNRELIRNLVEEAFVRAWSMERVRLLAQPFQTVRTPARWVFLVGCYNSGTTLLQKLLGAHPDIASLPREGVRFTSVLSNLEVNGHHMMWDENFRSLARPDIDMESAYRQLGADWSIFWKKGANVFLEKSVSNTARIEWLADTFPEAHFVGIHRNGFCVSEGLYRRARAPAWIPEREADARYPIEMAARQWVYANDCILEQFPRIKHSLLVGFENLVESPLGQLTEILEFIGVSADTLSVESGTVRLGGRDFSVHNPNPSSLQRLGVRRRQELEPILGDVMTRLGYDVA